MTATSAAEAMEEIGKLLKQLTAQIGDEDALKAVLASLDKVHVDKAILGKSGAGKAINEFKKTEGLSDELKGR